MKNGNTFNGDELVSYSSGSWKIGDDSSIDNYLNFYSTYYPMYWGTYNFEKSKIEQAFKIVNKLMENQIIKNITLKNFIKLVNDISEII